MIYGTQSSTMSRNASDTVSETTISLPTHLPDSLQRERNF
jgi:hypothetical protein